MTNYQKALAIDPKNAEAHNNLGVVMAGDRRLEEAVSHIETALAINPDFAEAHCNLGSVLAACGFARKPLATTKGPSSSSPTTPKRPTT